MTTGLKMGRHMGLSDILARVPIDNYTAGVVDPFPYSSPESTFDATNGGATTGMLGNGPDDSLSGFGGAGNCVFRGMQVAQMRNSWLAGETPVGDLSLWPSTIANLLAYFIFQGAPSFATWCDQNGQPAPTPNTPSSQYVVYFTWCQDNGYDQGCDVGVALLWGMTNQIGTMPVLKGFAGVPTNGQFFQGGIGLFGVFLDAILVNNEMMADSEQSPPAPWDQTNPDWIGGHLPPVIYRDPKVAKYDTWNLVQPGDWPNWRAVREEGAVVVDNSILIAPDGTFHGVAVADLTSDIAVLAKEFPVDTPEARRELILSTVSRKPSFGQVVAAAKLIVQDVTELAAEGAKDAAEVLADAAAPDGDLKAAEAAAADVEAIAKQAEGDAEDVIKDLEEGEAPKVGGLTTTQEPTSPSPTARETTEDIRGVYRELVAAKGIPETGLECPFEPLGSGAWESTEALVTQHIPEKHPEDVPALVSLLRRALESTRGAARISDVNNPVKVDQQGRPLGVPWG